MSEDSRTNENKLVAVRRQKLAALRQQGQAYPDDFRRLDTSAALITDHGGQSAEALAAAARQTRVAGRILRMRGPFLVIQDGYGRLQLYLNHQQLDAQQNAVCKALDLGDIIGAEGEVFKTRKGELTVRVATLRLLTKALRPLPDKHKGLVDTEMRYRQRYVDLIVNQQSHRVFVLRAGILRCIRDFLAARGFIEVETPMMHLIPGGATARPFVTHHHALNQPMYLRVAPELHLKRLVVGGFERVYELNRSFRNEGLSTRHNPEFTMLEFYQAYASYQDLLELTETLLRQLAEQVLGTTRVVYQGITCDLSRPFRRLSMREAIMAECEPATAESFDSIESVRRLARALDIQCDQCWPKGRIIMEIFEQRVEHTLQQPVFVCEHPADVSPLARPNDVNPEVADRFELYIAGRELANGFSELNDPEEQAARFAAQVQQKQAGDQEAMHYDDDYITALEYGLPPTAGEGIGIDRLVMLLTDAPSIKDVLLFPHMRPDD